MVHLLLSLTKKHFFNYLHNDYTLTCSNLQPNRDSFAVIIIKWLHIKPLKPSDCDPNFDKVYLDI